MENNVNVKYNDALKVNGDLYIIESSMLRKCCRTISKSDINVYETISFNYLSILMLSGEAKFDNTKIIALPCCGSEVFIPDCNFANTTVSPSVDGNKTIYDFEFTEEFFKSVKYRKYYFDGFIVFYLYKNELVPLLYKKIDKELVFEGKSIHLIYEVTNDIM